MSARGAAAAQPGRRPVERPRPRTRPQVVPRSRRRPRFRLRIRLGLAVIPLIAALFAGVVYINAAELRVTKRQGQVARQMAAVQEQLAQLRSVQAQKDVTVGLKADELGMIRPKSDELRYVKARPAAGR